MRVISGTLKGRRLKAPAGMATRPTADRIKESVFNILAGSVQTKRVLDLFAGTGNISYECASRGCPHVVAVDAHPGCIRFIQKTAGALELPIHTYKRDVLKFLKQCEEDFDLIFADPPYNLPETELAALASLCLERGLLKKGGVLVIEHGPKKDLSQQEGFTEMRKYGSFVFIFFRGARNSGMSWPNCCSSWMSRNPATNHAIFC